jgi:hypothetical protein
VKCVLAEKYVDLDKLLGVPRNRIKKVGIELEGGWTNPPIGSKIERDASVFHDDPPVGYKVGEMPLGPMQVIQVKPVLKKYYPNLVDKTCGMHVHMSFETLFQYVLLADSPAYQETVLEYFRRWAEKEAFPKTHYIWERLDGKNIFCQKKFWPREQMQTTRKDYDKVRHGHRYTIIHYCFERHRTLECRVLPMMPDHVQAFSAIKLLFDVTNAYLLQADKAKVKEFGKVSVDEIGAKVKLELRKGEIYEEYYEE